MQKRYGRDQVAQIITFGTLQARGVLRDVGRVLQMPYGQVDKLTKLVPQNPAAPVTLAAAINGEPKLQAFRDSDPVVARAFDIAQKLEGLTRHASTHAAGIVIGDRPLSELVPLYRDPKSDMPVTQFNMKWVEPAGLVKFDFLGLKTLTVLDVAVKLLQQRGVDDRHRPRCRSMTRQATQMLARGEVVGVFQVESQGMRRALVDMRPDRFEDIIALVALYRPGPMANIPTYCARKHGDEEPEYLHPMLEPILKETFGVIIYQEQVMQIAQIDGRLFARRSRPAAPRDGQEDPRGDGAAARRASWPARSSAAFQQAQAEAIFDAAARNSPTTASTRATRRPTRWSHLPDRLHEGALSGRVPGGVDDARTEQHRQAVGISRRGAAARHQDGAAVDQPLGRRVRCANETHLLCAGGAEGRRACGRRDDRRGARRPAVHLAGRLRRARAAEGAEQAGDRKPRRRRRVRYDRAEPRARLRRRRRDPRRLPEPVTRPRPPASTACSVRRRTRRR